MMDAVVSIFEACNFQDITGQRIGKVVRTLDFIEERVVAMIQTWGPEAFAHLPHSFEVPVAEEAKLLNGPQFRARRSVRPISTRCSTERALPEGSGRLGASGPGLPSPNHPRTARRISRFARRRTSAPAAQQVAFAERLDHQVGDAGSEGALVVVGVQGCP